MEVTIGHSKMLGLVALFSLTLTPAWALFERVIKSWLLKRE